MNKIIASASLAAFGAASLHAAYAPGLSPQEQSKPWSLSAALRGFYDDNSTTSSSAKVESFGIEVSPTLGINLALDQTLIGFSYTYNLRWYEGRDQNSADHSHLANLKLDHAFNERYKLSLRDSFVAAQEQQVIDTDLFSTLSRNNGNNIRNTAQIGFNAELTHNVGLGVSYVNRFYDYDADGFPDSRSAVLDRLEHVGGIDVGWQVLPATRGVFGYQYEIVDYTSSDSLTVNVYTDPETRNRRTHFVFVGVDQNFTSQLSASVRLGGHFTDYPDAVSGDDSSSGPYADAKLEWAYNPGSYMQLGLKHSRNSTDLAYPGGAGFTSAVLDQESTGIYGVINHRITPKCTGSLLGQFQRSTFEGGFADDETDLIFLVGINLAQQINEFLTAEAGYNYDRLDSDLSGRSFTRNRVYIGLRASY